MVYKINADADRVYLDEFRQKTIGAHSPGLQRVLNIMRLYAGGDQYVLVCRKRFVEFVIGRMPPDRSDMIVVEDDVVFPTREEAEWELFKRRWRLHTGEIINLPYRD